MDESFHAEALPAVSLLDSRPVPFPLTAATAGVVDLHVVGSDGIADCAPHSGCSEIIIDEWVRLSQILFRIK
jgi:hypothetical protein